MTTSADSSAIPPPAKITPMLQQYLEIKEQHRDAILFYRMGDFYEMFFDDAVIAAKVLGITLTSRSKNDEHKVPMCGIPFHAVSSYLGKMVKAGHRVAICEQVEDPKQAKTIVKREVIRVVTPGVTTEEHILDAKSNRYVCALVPQRTLKKNRTIGLSFLDLSTGDFLVSELQLAADNFDPVLDEITRMEPAEILVPEAHLQQLDKLLSTLKIIFGSLCLTTRPEINFEHDLALANLTEHFRTSNLAGFGCETMSAAIRAAGGLLAYIRETQKTDLSHINKLRPLNPRDYLIIDESSRRNLELTETIIGGKREGSLLSIVDFTQTPMGARLLRQRLLFPLQRRDHIQRRLDSVELLVNDDTLRQNLREILANIYDLERLCSRIALGHGNARDMLALKTSLAQLPALKALDLALPPGLLRTIGEELDTLPQLHQILESAIREDAPVTIREGRLIREKYRAELDELIELDRNGKQLILALEQKERERTGIAKLKVGYNKIFGYYFEVSRLQAETIPADFIRKQTLVNAERFVSQELKELEDKISTAWEKRLELEYALFLEIRNQIAAQSGELLSVALQIARLDFLACLAEAARRNRYVKPTITPGRTITITEGRHPVIEQALEPGRFVPNDVHLDQDQHELLIITGPNMAGKSTILRQTALIALLAHLGSFVPADSAEICLVDRIFTRVGAMDDLRRGQSTFMVEMNETANILNNATDKSLVILDEIGRGTSTYDGLAIAWAVVEELAGKDGHGVKTLFATHYHELTELEESHPRIRNYSIAVREWQSSIIFLHKLVQGATNKSYGIQVAGLAGVPQNVINRAHEILQLIESKGKRAGEREVAALPPAKHAKQVTVKKEPQQLSLFAPEAHPLTTLILEQEPETTTPLAALQLLYKAHELIKRKERT